MRLPRVRHVYVSQSRLVPDRRTDNRADDQLVATVSVKPATGASVNVSTNDSPNQADEQIVVQTNAGETVATLPNNEEAKRKAEADQQADKQADKQDFLLVKEVDETNNWARLGAQLYFGWFTLMVTINGVAIGWLFNNRGTVPRFARAMFFIFLILNLMGTITTILIRKHMLECDQRIQEVLGGLTKDRASEANYFAPQSPVPRQAVNTVFGFTSAVLFMLLFFWMILALWPEEFLT